MAIIAEGGGTTTQVSPTIVAPKEETTPVTRVSTSTGSTSTRSTSTTPTAPGPTCPPGTSLYKVSTADGVKYIYASSTATKSQLEALAGSPGMITKVMSPAAYEGGAYPTSREVTTVSGEKVSVPYDPRAEARQEYIKLYGPAPSTKASESEKAAYQSIVSTLQSKIAAGTYASPLAVPSSYITGLMTEHDWTPRQAQMEALQIYNQVAREMNTPACGDGPWNLQKGETLGAIAYLEDRGRLDEADTIRSFYVSGSSDLGRQLERAEAVNYLGVFKDLAPYRTGVSYDFPTACARGVCSESSLKTMGFSPDIISGIMVAANALKSLWSAPSDLYNPETKEANLAGLIGSGNLTEAQASLLFSKEDVETALATMGPSLGPSVFDINQELVGGQPGLGEQLGSWWDQFSRAIKGMDSPEQAAIFFNPFGAPAQAAGIVEPLPEALAIGQAGAFTAAGLIGTGIVLAPTLVPLVSRNVGSVLQWAVKPIAIGGHPLASALLTAAKLAAGRLLPVTMATTGAGLGAGLFYQPEAPTAKTERILGGITTEQRESMLSDYLRDAASSYDEIVTGGQTPTVSREEFLEQAEAEFSPRLSEAVLGQVSESMAYQPGLTGWLGRSGELLSIPLRGIESLKVPGIIKGLASGFYQVAAPLTVATALWPEKGWKSFATMFPYYGPITVAGALTWREQPWYGKLATVGFTALPAVSGAIGYIRSPKLSARELQLRKLGIGEPLKDIGIVEPVTGYKMVQTPLGQRLVSFFQGARPVGDVFRPGEVSARVISPSELVGLTGKQTWGLNVLSRLKQIIGGKARPASELYPFREPMGYRSEYIGMPEGPVKATPGFLSGGQLLPEYTYKTATLSYPLEGATPYTGGTVAQWMASWAEFGGLSKNLWGPQGWGKGGLLWGGGGSVGLGGGVATKTQIKVDTMTETTLAGMQGELISPLEGTLRTQPLYGTRVFPTLGLTGIATAGIATESVLSPLLTIPLMATVATEFPSIKTTVATPITTPKLTELKELVLTPVTTPVTVSVTMPVPQPEPLPYQPTPTPPTPFIPPFDYTPGPITPWPGEPKPKIVPPPLLGGAPGLSIPITGGMKGLLRGSQWIIPGAILHMPEPFGKVGKRKISLWKEKRPRYGAKSPRLVTGGLRI